MKILTSDWLKYLEGAFRSIPTSSYVAFITVFSLAALSYSYYGISLTLDQEGLGSITSRMNEMEMNYRGAARPLLWLISSRLMPGSFMPVLNILIASACLSLAAILCSRVFSHSTLSATLSASILATFPLFSASLPLHLWNVAFGISYLTACAALYLVALSGRWVTAGFLLALTFSNYQSSVGLFCAGIVARMVYLATFEEDAGELFRLALRALFAGLLGALIYAPIFLYFSSSASGYSAAQTEVISSFKGLGSNLLNIISINFQRATGEEFYRQKVPLLFAALFALYGLFSAWEIALSRGKLAAIYLGGIALAWLALIVVATPVELFLEGSFLWSRGAIALAMPVSLACAVLVDQKRSILLKNLAVLVSFLLIFSFVQYHNVSAFTQQMINKHNFALGIRIADRIEQLDEYDRSQNYRIVAANLSWEPVHAAGSRIFTSNNVTNVYAYQFRWYVGNHFKILGMNNVEFHDSAEQVLESHKHLIDTMRAWPQKGSVQIAEDNVIIIKF